MGLSMSEILIILLIVLLLFGAKKIPEIARALGKASNEFQKARDNVAEEVEKASAERKPEDKDQEEKNS